MRFAHGRAYRLRAACCVVAACSSLSTPALASPNATAREVVSATRSVEVVQPAATRTMGGMRVLGTSAGQNARVSFGFSGSGVSLDQQLKVAAVPLTTRSGRIDTSSVATRVHTVTQTIGEGVVVDFPFGTLQLSQTDPTPLDDSDTATADTVLVVEASIQSDAPAGDYPVAVWVETINGEAWLFPLVVAVSGQRSMELSLESVDFQPAGVALWPLTRSHADVALQVRNTGNQMVWGEPEIGMDGAFGFNGTSISSEENAPSPAATPFRVITPDSSETNDAQRAKTFVLFPGESLSVDTEIPVIPGLAVAPTFAIHVPYTKTDGSQSSYPVFTSAPATMILPWGSIVGIFGFLTLLAAVWVWVRCHALAVGRRHA
ncbi:hypothetical protein CFELI_06580 [Corynebacterium felinum]|uniref:hypothetical protein n=1 Tax=Corynebacterium felinum TaxID=131318 RepID=UPI00286B3BA8|nr:hypothetical protein [Corynebacterium felinum]WJY94933.1 hypothetical protein CFELI_06580 [Corynebacterium felinum]